MSTPHRHILTLATALLAAVAGVPTHAAGAPGTTRTDTLTNGLTVIQYECECLPERASVTLEIAPPPTLPGTRAYRCFEIAARSMFQGTDSTSLRNWLSERDGTMMTRSGYQRTVIQFDVPVMYIRGLHVYVAQQWERGLTHEQIAEGRRRAIEAAALRERPAIEDVWSLAGADAGAADLEDLSTTDIQQSFQSCMTADRMALVVTGAPGALLQAAEALTALEGIPQGWPLVSRTTNYASFLKGETSWPGGAWKEVSGFTSPIGEGWTPEALRICTGALALRITESLAWLTGRSNGIESQFVFSDNECLVLFEPYFDGEPREASDIPWRIKDVAVSLADTSNVAWWREYLDRRSQWSRNFGRDSKDPSGVAFDVGHYVDFASDGHARFALTDTLDAAAAIEKYRELMESAQWFTIEANPARTRGPAAHLDNVFATIWRDLLGPTNGSRIVALACLLGLHLLLLRRVDRWLRRNDGLS